MTCKLPIYSNLLNRQFKITDYNNPNYDCIKNDLGYTLSFTDGSFKSYIM